MDAGVGEAMAISALIGAGVGGATSAATGQDPLKGALIGGIGGAVTGGAMGAFGGAGSAAATDVTAQIGTEIANMSAAGATQAEINTALQATYGMTEAQAQAAMAQMANTGTTAGGIATGTAAGGGAGGAASGATASVPTEMAPVNTPMEGVPPPNAAPSSGVNMFGDSGIGPSSLPANTPQGTFSEGFMKGLSDNAKPAAVGALGIGALAAMNSDKKKYGVPATEHYTGPLNDFHYDPKTFKPTYPIQPNPAYQAQYRDYVSQPYAEGGITQLPQDKNFAAGGMYPMSQIDHTQYASSPQTPVSMQATMAGYDPRTNPLTGEETTHMARGGIAQLAEGGDTSSHIYKPQYIDYRQQAGASAPATQMQPQGQGFVNPSIPIPTSRTPMDSGSKWNPLYIPHTPTWQAEQDRLAAIEAAKQAEIAAASQPSYGGDGGGGAKAGGLMHSYAGGGIAGLLKGRGDGMSDSIRATIADKQPARLADGEFVVPADVVSHLGNGSTDAGAKHLYKMMDKVRKARTGTKKQGKQIAAGGYLPA